MKKILFLSTLTVSFLFSSIDLQTASKSELICIKGIGIKKADAIIQYRKSNKITSADDLLKIKGFGKALVAKVKKGEQTVRCRRKKAIKVNNSSNVDNSTKTSPKVANKQNSAKSDKK